MRLLRQGRVATQNACGLGGVDTCGTITPAAPASSAVDIHNLLPSGSPASLPASLPGIFPRCLPARSDHILISAMIEKKTGHRTSP